MNDTVLNIYEYVKKELRNEATGHDYFHTKRVYHLALELAQGTEANIEVVSIAALLHDIADYKLHNNDETINVIRAEEIMNLFHIEKNIIKEVVSIIDNISYKDSKQKKMNSLEGKIVQDADRLDALGANGIARLFAFGGKFGHVIFDDEILPKPDLTKAEYIDPLRKTTSFNHFYEKILKLCDLMNTEQGKKEAQKRHDFVVEFMKQFLKENHIEDSKNKSYFNI